MVESLGRIKKLLQFVELRFLQIKRIPVCLEPIVHLLNMKEILSCKLDGIPNLLATDLVGSIVRSTMQDSEPQLDAQDGIIMDLDSRATSFLEPTVEHGFEGRGVVDENLTRDLHQGSLEDVALWTGRGEDSLILNDLNSQVTGGVNFEESGILSKSVVTPESKSLGSITSGADILTFFSGKPQRERGLRLLRLLKVVEGGDGQRRLRRKKLSG